MPVFQIGVILSKKILTDVIVRVEATTEKEAQKLAMAEIHRRVSVPMVQEDSDFGLSYDVDWEELHEFECEGISENNYSDDSPKGYKADIDLTRKDKSNVTG